MKDFAGPNHRDGKADQPRSTGRLDPVPCAVEKGKEHTNPPVDLQPAVEWLKFTSCQLMVDP